MSQSRIDRMLNDVRITSHGKLVILTVAGTLAVAAVAVTSLLSREPTAGGEIAGAVEPQVSADEHGHRPEPAFPR
jgi:hypothetical protein